MTQQVSQLPLITSSFTRYSCVLQLGNVYIADTGNHRIRKVTMSTATSSPRYVLLIIELDYSLTHSLTHSLTQSLTQSFTHSLTHSSLLPYSSSIIPSVLPTTTAPSTPSPRYEIPILWHPFAPHSFTHSFTHSLTHSIFIHLARVLLWYRQLQLQPRPHPVVVTQV